MDKEQAHIALSDEMTQVILGSILGDGCITRSPSKNGNLGLKITHGFRQAEYLDWKSRLLGDVVSIVKRQKKGNSGFTPGGEEAVMNTKHMPQLTKVLKPWTGVNGKKRICPEALQEMDLLGIAIWYFDDGSLQKPKRLPGGQVRDATITFCTFSFSTEEIESLKQLLRDRCHISPKDSVHIGRGKRYSGIRLHGDDARRFISIMRSIPGITDSGMNYKIPPDDEMRVTWKKCVMPEQKRALLKLWFGVENESEAARRYGVSRRTISRWLKRDTEEEYWEKHWGGKCNACKTSKAVKTVYDWVGRNEESGFPMFTIKCDRCHPTDDEHSVSVPRIGQGAQGELEKLWDVKSAMMS